MQGFETRLNETLASVEKLPAAFAYRLDTLAGGGLVRRDRANPSFSCGGSLRRAEQLWSPLPSWDNQPANNGRPRSRLAAFARLRLGRRCPQRPAFRNWSGF